MHFFFAFSLISIEGSDLCFEIVKRATAGFVYSEAVARYAHVFHIQMTNLFSAALYAFAI